MGESLWITAHSNERGYMVVRHEPEREGLIQFEYDARFFERETAAHDHGYGRSSRCLSPHLVNLNDCSMDDSSNTNFLLHLKSLARINREASSPPHS